MEKVNVSAVVSATKCAGSIVALYSHAEILQMLSHI